VSGPAKRGGVLRVGFISGGSTETLDPWVFSATNDYCRIINLYDTLYVYDDNLNVQPALVESGEPNGDQTQWTFRLRDGVTFHDGSALSADDVIYNFREWVNPNAIFYGQVGFQVNPKQITKVDEHTVRVGLLAANAQFPRDLAFLFGSIKSRNEKKGGPPIGTGPFKYVSFTPGKQSVFDRNPNYWRAGEPYVDQLLVNSSFTDENARANALRSGAIDVLPVMPFPLVASMQSGGTTVLRAKSGAFQNFYMRVDVAPFNDVRVRQAMRFLVDREQMVEAVYAGYGGVSNDVPGRYDPLYDESLTRSRDVEQAKSLLKQAGRENLTVTLQTSTAITGLEQAATLFKQQALDAGVHVNLAQVDPSAYFSTDYGKLVFAQTVYYPVPSMDFVWTASFASTDVVNETHFFKAPGYQQMLKWLSEARATADPNKAGEIWHQLQLQQFNEGGYLNWGTNDLVDALSTKVMGLTPSKYLNASSFNFRKAWLNT
jgi:peptide/nickel transport system substrate-binding protein